MEKALLIVGIFVTSLNSHAGFQWSEVCKDPETKALYHFSEALVKNGNVEEYDVNITECLNAPCMEKLLSIKGIVADSGIMFQRIDIDNQSKITDPELSKFAGLNLKQTVVKGITLICGDRLHTSSFPALQSN